MDLSRADGARGNHIDGIEAERAVAREHDVCALVGQIDDAHARQRTLTYWIPLLEFLRMMPGIAPAVSGSLRATG